MKEKWDALSGKEQKLVLFMSGLIVVFLFIQLVWLPLNENVKLGKENIARQQQLYQWIQENTAHYQASAGQGNNANNGELSMVINQSAARRQIRISRIHPQENALQLTLEDVEFNRLVDWIQQLSQENKISVQAIDIVKTDVPGVVSVKKLTLGKG